MGWKWKKIRWSASKMAAIMAAVLVHSFTYFPERVEAFYGGLFYPHWSILMRSATGLLPFSLGDMLYILVIVWLLYRLLRFRKTSTSAFMGSLLVTCCWIYVCFQLSWGLNYSRHAVEQKLKIFESPSDSILLHGLTASLLERIKEFAPARRPGEVRRTEDLEKAIVLGYSRIPGGVAPGQPSSLAVKQSLFGVIGNYLGYSGYFNPFTGEAQLNHTIPDVLHPFVMAHEMGHQLGYAREQEANLMGFLAARASGDSLLRYSAYFDMFLYANAGLSQTDSLAADAHLNRLPPEAKSDLESLRRFRAQYKSPVERAINILYDRYLKVNGQSAGTYSYGRVVRNLLAIYRMEGSI